ncbi:uncharacterized protein DUF2536 [Paenibacillus cellulosilyticus]|uniref:Uncharacterized protein DUF2536 n=1 Tax=Paenibacillus cellulosilyticus TaxID=375489 RepID=A0A2V2YTC2_9BACL|nr:DUF2536 family protein [Paenibacillus cellulosilyticus]PWV98521.1 uncharacterized protein DUF2536 [Paenibacillus cellulosilyticus]QKS44129.1 DUF2536 family protein [Paenibacillus cellulosilyticus]
MSFMLERITDKVECFEAYDMKTLEKKIEEQIEKNKALMLQVHAVTHNVVFDHNHKKMHYSAVVHFKA